MVTRTFSFSTLIQRQTAVFPALDDADVVLERRDAEDLVLMRSERYEASLDGLRFAAKALALIAGRHAALAEEVLAEELPWLHWLPPDERPECVRELLADLVAGADTGLLLPFARNLRAWRWTAEAWSDPETARQLTSPFDGTGGGEASRPVEDGE